MRNLKVAPEGMIYTDGITYGTKISLGDGVNEKDWYLITKEEYEQILTKQNGDFKED